MRQCYQAGFLHVTGKLQPSLTATKGMICHRCCEERLLGGEGDHGERKQEANRRSKSLLPSLARKPPLVPPVDKPLTEPAGESTGVRCGLSVLYHKAEYR